MERDLQDVRGNLDEVMRDRLPTLRRIRKMTQGMIVESNTKMDVFARALNEADLLRRN